MTPRSTALPDVLQQRDGTSKYLAVIRLGGSLLSLPALADRLQELTQLLSGWKLLFVVGGGVAADEIRRLDTRIGLGNHAAHWSAIAAMSFNAELLARLNQPWLRFVRSRHEAEATWKAGLVSALDAEGFLHDELAAGRLPEIPESWDITSDSLSALIAGIWPAEALILAKSCELPTTILQNLPGSNVIDPLFPQFASRQTILWVNLRSRQSLRLVLIEHRGN